MLYYYILLVVNFPGNPGNPGNLRFPRTPLPFYNQTKGFIIKQREQYIK